jgi:DNA topoisomerase-1
VDLIARKMASVRTLGPHPTDKQLVAVRKGRFGPYVQHGKTVANLPRGVMMEDITLDQAVVLLAEKGKQLRPRGAGGRRGRSAASPQPAPAAEPAPTAPRKAKPAKRRTSKAKRAAPKKAAKATAKRKSVARRKAAARQRAAE